MESSEYKGSRIGFVLNPPEASVESRASSGNGMVEVPEVKLREMANYVMSLERRVMELEGRRY